MIPRRLMVRAVGLALRAAESGEQATAGTEMRTAPRRALLPSRLSCHAAHAIQRRHTIQSR